MDKIYDFSNDKLLNRPLGGTDRKNPVEHNGVAYMLKYTEVHAKKGDMSTSHLNSITSEYISSHISASTGLDTHHTLLGYRNGEAVVACQDFRQPYESNIEFGEYVRGLYTMEEIGRVLRLDQIYGTIKNASNIPEELKQPSIDRYWDTFVIDALVGDFDRHKGNWGYIAEPDDSLRLAPVYDFGSTLLPQLSDSGAKDIINDPFRMAERCLVFPSPALFIGTEKNGKPGYYDLLASGFDENCTRALLRMAPKINMDKMNQIIEETPFISNIKRIFYKKYIALRKALVIDRAYERCIETEGTYQKHRVSQMKDQTRMPIATHSVDERVGYASFPYQREDKAYAGPAAMEESLAAGPAYVRLDRQQRFSSLPLPRPKANESPRRKALYLPAGASSGRKALFFYQFREPFVFIIGFAPGSGPSFQTRHAAKRCGPSGQKKSASALPFLFPSSTQPQPCFPGRMISIRRLSAMPVQMRRGLCGLLIPLPAFSAVKFKTNHS